MPSTPDPGTLLRAIARFLAADVLDEVKDPAARFRVRIAAHTLGGIARELAVGSDLARSELAALGAEVPADSAALPAAVTAARRAVIDRIRAPSTSPDELAHLRKALLEIEGASASLGQPRFVRDLHIEEPR